MDGSFCLAAISVMGQVQDDNLTTGNYSQHYQSVLHIHSKQLKTHIILKLIMTASLLFQHFNLYLKGLELQVKACLAT